MPRQNHSVLVLMLILDILFNTPGEEAWWKTGICSPPKGLKTLSHFLDLLPRVPIPHHVVQGRDSTDHLFAVLKGPPHWP